MRHLCIPFIFVLILAAGLTSCGKTAETVSSSSPDSSEASDSADAASPDRGAYSIPGLSAESGGTGSTAAAAGEISALPSDRKAGSAVLPDSGDGDVVHGMDHSAVRRRPEHTENDLVYDPPVWQAPSGGTEGSGGQSRKTSGSPSKKKSSRKKNKIGSTSGPSGGF